MEALYTCPPQSAAGVDSSADRVWQLGEGEQHSDASQTLRGPSLPPPPPEAYDAISQRGLIYYPHVSDLADRLALTPATCIN